MRNFKARISKLEKNIKPSATLRELGAEFWLNSKELISILPLRTSRFFTTSPLRLIKRTLSFLSLDNARMREFR